MTVKISGMFDELALKATAMGLATALGAGLLIGLERERRKGRGSGRSAAGIRSFALAALGGGIAQTLDIPGVVLLGGVLVGALASLAYWRSRIQTDPGLTSELAFFMTYLVGVLAVQRPAVGAGVAVMVAALLALREPLHRFATQIMTQAELYDALLLAALALVLLPLLPREPIVLLAGTVPRQLLYTVVLILGMQAMGHIGLRLFGQRAGLALSGLFSGFVSSTATIASLGARLKKEPALASACMAGAILSTTSTWIQLFVLVTTLSPSAASTVAPAVLAGASTALLCAWPPWQKARAQVVSAPVQSAQHGPLSLRAACMVAVLLAIASAGVGWAQSAFGSLGLFLGIAVAALADAHSSAGALTTLYNGGKIGPDLILQGILVAVAANSVSRTMVAAVTGGGSYAWRIGLSMALSTSAAAGFALFLH